MGRSTLAWLLIVLLCACAAPVPTPSNPPTSVATIRPSPSAPRPAETPDGQRLAVRLFTTMAEPCGSIGGCAAYATIGFAPPGSSMPATPETRLSMLGERRATDGLPPMITRGPYVARFRVVAVSDERVVGQDPDEFTLGTCEASFDGTGRQSVTIEVVFRGSTCEATADLS